MALLCCGMYAMALVVWLTTMSYNSVGEALMLTSVAMAISWFMIRFGRARVEIHEGGLVIIDVVRREWIPWGAYRRVDTDEGLTIITRGDKEHSSAAFGGSLIDEMLKRRGKSSTVKAATEIKAASRAASPESLREKEVTVKRWELIPADLLLAQVLVCLALTQSGILPM